MWLILHAWVRVVEGPGLGVEAEGGTTGESLYIGGC